MNLSETPAAQNKPDQVARYEVSANIAWRKIGGEGFLITRDGTETHRLNATATRVLELLLDGKARADIVSTLSGEFEASPTEIQGDVDEIIGTMVARGVLVKKESA